MFSLTHLHSPPPEAFAGQVQQLLLDNLTTLGSVALAPSNPLYPLYQYGLGMELHQYLQAMGGAAGEAPVLLLALAAEAPEQVLGFALYLPAAGVSDACTLLYLAVLASHRRQGIGQALLAEVTARYPHAELACQVARVPWLEAQGWHVLAAQGPQVLMNTRARRTLGKTRLLDVAPIYRTLEVQQIHAYLLKQHGRKAMVEAEKQRDYWLDQLERQVRVLVAERLLGIGPVR
ncbi:GNAT family N-acetyltransferase [Pseudomonas sp. NPDC007930]|uniref:GNAT family N-acetyltransferase n=1 Tax=Pseudomonas sp. NPDC007930 TaxID=3364417 RepID=UPI0036EB71E4